MSSRAVLAVAGLATGLALAGAAQASTLIPDGDFSAPYGGGGFTTEFTSFGPWTVTSGSVDLIGGYWQAPGGVPNTGSVDLDGDSPGGISQTFALAPGSYDLTFDLSGNPDGSPATKTVDVSVNSASGVYQYTIGLNSHSNMLYLPESLAFTTTGSTTVSFTSVDVGTPYGPVVGDISVTSVPEPASWALMLVGFCGLGGALRRRNRLAIA